MLEWVDPHPLMIRSRFFVMAARYVFGNNALLESMSMGCVPIVSKAPGVELLIEDGVNGFACEPSIQALHSTLTHTLELSSDQWVKLSQAARETVEGRFSPHSLGPRISSLYLMTRTNST